MNKLGNGWSGPVAIQVKSWVKEDRMQIGFGSSFVKTMTIVLMAIGFHSFAFARPGRFEKENGRTRVPSFQVVRTEKDYWQ